MPVSYDFKRASQRTPRRGTGAKRLRFFAVLCIVAAVTAGVIMLIVPGKSDAATGSAETSGEKKSVPASGAENKDTPISPEENGSGNSDPGSVAETGNISGTGSDSSGANGGGSVLPPGKKGVEQPGDIPAGADNPEFRGNQAPGADEAVVQLEKMHDPDEIAAAARDFLMKEYSAGGEFSANWSRVGAKLAAAVCAKWQSRNWKKEGVVYKVAARDHLIRISRRHHSTVEGIKFINQRKNNFLRIGEKLTVVPGPWRITVSRKARLLNLWRKENNAWMIFAVFPVGVGRKNSTPNGSFIINHRLRHPKWYGPDGKVFAYGDKENPLGDYFLKLCQVDPHGMKKDKGYGIHGSADDSSVGRSLSNGCLRMRNQDVEILYYLLPGGCPVKIVD